MKNKDFDWTQVASISGVGTEYCVEVSPDGRCTRLVVGGGPAAASREIRTIEHADISVNERMAAQRELLLEAVDLVRDGLLEEESASWTTGVAGVPAGKADGYVRLAGLEGREFTLEGAPIDTGEFLRDNAESLSQDDVAAMRLMAVGQDLIFGGGAWAAFTLVRVK